MKESKGNLIVLEVKRIMISFKAIEVRKGEMLKKISK